MTNVFRSIYLQLTKRLYHEWSGLYDAVSFAVSLGQWDRWRLSVLPFVEGDDVLELGCGTGRLLCRLADGNRSSVGLDASSMMADRAARNACGSRGECHVVQALAQSLPFAAEQFDTVVATFPAAYVLDSETVYECARVLRRYETMAEAGRLVICGLWVDTDCPLLRYLFFVFYGPPNRTVLSVYANVLRDAGLSVAFLENQLGAFRIGTVVATRSA